jgi:hypothetical protein
MIAICKRKSIVAVFAVAVAMSCATSAFSKEALSFPPTSFAILNPTTGVAMGRARYRVETTPDGGILRGDNGYFDGQTDVETAHIEVATSDGQPKLTEFDHTFYNPDKSILKRAHVDVKSGAATCVDNSAGQKSEQSEVLTIPDDTWAGASIVIPIQNFLRAGDKGISRPLHAFSCAPTPKIFSISVDIDPGPAVWTTYGAEAIRVQVKPDLGLLNFLVAAFVPKLHAWFDPNDRLAFIGDEAARYYKGDPIMLVKKPAIDGTREAK